ncbi:serine carboxypeptidase domain-containing protein [Phthorimaea operculella]|nr:serine carboxypeptidase domain-containing protein [Phthorimaea operculella]
MMSVTVLYFLLLSTCLTHVHGLSDCEALYHTPHIENGSVSEAVKLSAVDPDFFLGINSHSGFITVNKEYNSNLFFWYFPHEDVKRVPFIIWLNGGPGVSSLLGMFDLIGPIKLVNGKVGRRNATWASSYSLLFIDSPVGAGFSYTDDDRGYTSSEEQVSDQLYKFLLQFLVLFPEQRETPLFIAGESYAGKYVPAFAAKIHWNNDLQNPINLKGIIMGNAMVDPRNVMHYTELTRELGLLEDPQLQELKALEDSMVSLIDQGRMVDAANKFNETIEYIKKKTLVSIYNYLEEATSIKSPLESFVTQPEVRCAIHAGNGSFNLNNQVVYNKMLPDIANSTRPMVEELLAKCGVLSYSGQLDLILPYSGSKRVYDLMQWPGREEYQNAPRQILKQHFGGGDKDKVVAYMKAGGNFFDVLIRNCGHMVPKEQPAVLKHIVDLFINMFK